ncbi:DUF488 family protein [Occallatibacter savannae]|uniref:DUF488 domain-containing protein n=1 Tax=Occallatibacter savannae TaxID=1002691 RepID=UPI000D689721|nr:DUF488 domain-containing protein [Occallatibacter savannae]
MAAIYTVGHSTHSQMRFLELLAHHAINMVCDVRSTPRSRLNPQFNLEELDAVLPRNEIEYVFLGKELGARSPDRSCYVEGTVQYELLAKTEAFKGGLDRVKELFDNGFRIALMCAEKEPLQCHRSILIARYLVAEGFEVQHILPNGELEDHGTSMRRLSELLGLSTGNMFRSPIDLETEAYKRQEHRIAFRRPSPTAKENKNQVREH